MWLCLLFCVCTRMCVWKGCKITGGVSLRAQAPELELSSSPALPFSSHVTLIRRLQAPSLRFRICKMRIMPTSEG